MGLSDWLAGETWLAQCPRPVPGNCPSSPAAQLPEHHKQQQNKEACPCHDHPEVIKLGLKVKKSSRGWAYGSHFPPPARHLPVRP